VAQLQRTGATLSRVARATGLSTSTAFRILRTLSEERLLRYDPVGRHYHTGSLAFELGLASPADARLQSDWRETIARIAGETRLTSYLMARSDNDAVCLLCIQGSAPRRAMPMEVGQRMPLGLGAGSLAMLAALPDDEVDRIIAAQQSRLDMLPGGRKARQIVDRVGRTRQRGFAISSGTVAHGLTGIGVAIPSVDGAAQLAISVSAVIHRIDPVEAAAIAGTIAAAIRRRAG
jgi:DNA-binding IclR family transcriptional regulator